MPGMVFFGALCVSWRRQFAKSLTQGEPALEHTGSNHAATPFPQLKMLRKPGLRKAAPLRGKHSQKDTNTRCVKPHTPPRPLSYVKKLGVLMSGPVA